MKNYNKWLAIAQVLGIISALILIAGSFFILYRFDFINNDVGRLFSIALPCMVGWKIFTVIKSTALSARPSDKEKIDFNALFLCMMVVGIFGLVGTEIEIRTHGSALSVLALILSLAVMVMILLVIGVWRERKLKNFMKKSR